MSVLFGEEVRMHVEHIIHAEFRCRVSERAIQGATSRRDQYLDMDQEGGATLRKLREETQATFKPYLSSDEMMWPVSKLFRNAR